MVPGIMLEWHDLNARHEATLLWLAAMLIIGIAGSAEARRSVCDLLKMLLEPTISLLIVGLLANVIFLTFIAAIVGREVGLWETLPVVTAIVWALTTGFSLLLHLGELLEPTISLLIVGLLANVIFLTFIAAIVGREVGLWETLPVVTAIVWALTTGFSLLLHLGELLEGANAFRSRVFRILGPSTVVAEIVGVSVLETRTETPDSPQNVVFPASIIDVTVAS